jgi:hypothetical protein
MDVAPLSRLISPFAQSPVELLARFASFARPDKPTALPVSSDQAQLQQAAQSPGRVLDTEILRALEQALARDGLELDRQAEVADYTPQQLANRIIGSVEAAAAQFEAGDPRRAALVEQAREGIERGFQEARDVLQGLGVLQGDIAANIDRTYELVQEGLESLLGGASAAAGDSGPVAAAQVSALRSASYSTSQSTSLVIDTLDGDRVTIEIDKQASASRSVFAASDGVTQVSGFQVGREASVEFSFHVEGELDQEEQRAIESLIKRIDKVSDKFFNGQMQAAFAKAGKLKFDSSELAGFSLDMNSTQTYQAVAAYQQSSPEPVATGSLADAAALGGEVRGLIEEADQQTVVAEPARDVARLFHHLVDERADSGIENLKKEAMASLRELVDSIVESYSPHEVAEVEAVHEGEEHEHEDKD